MRKKLKICQKFAHFGSDFEKCRRATPILLITGSSCKNTEILDHDTLKSLDRGKKLIVWICIYLTLNMNGHCLISGSGTCVHNLHGTTLIIVRHIAKVTN